MYRLMYYFIFLLVHKKSVAPKFYSAGIVFLAQLFHFLLGVVLLQKVFDHRILPLFSETYLINKLSVMPFLAVWLIIVDYYFNKMLRDIEKKFEEKDLVSLKNGVILFLVLAVPLSLIIYLKS